ncbi:hypothetical protein [Paenibacillus cymbidii]|uniref:hypothetical protein n=1 Tax=Paenibacillus cymbidii TaxID=1639034 RepID=UPI0010816C12|nr:hypothetical protein [Paenibacillus cymbidii]
MKDQISDKVFEYIDALAAKLGVAAEYVFTLMIRQMVMEGIVYICVSVVLLVASILGARKLYAFWREKDFEIEDCEGLAIFSVLLGIAMLVTIIVVTTIVLPESIMKLTNPGYYALKEILEAFGSK